VFFGSLIFQVYDITDADSFTKVKNWVKELRKMLGSDICLTIAGNLKKIRQLDCVVKKLLFYAVLLTLFI
jgi:GTPase SAR1 family protein